MTEPRRFALGDLPVALLLLAPDGRVLEATADAAAQLGLGAIDLTGTNLLALVDSPQRSALRDALKGVLDEPSATPTVSTEIRVGAVLHRVELSLRALAAPGAGGDAALPEIVLVGVQSRAGERRLEATLDALADTTLLLDINGLVEWQSGSSAARLPNGAESGIGINPLERLHPEDLPNVLDIWAEAVVAEGTRVSYTARSRAVNDDDLWQLIEIRGSSQLQNPYLQAMVVQIRNLDEGEVVESVAEEDGPMQSLADAAPIGIVVTDAYNRTIYRNAAAKALLEQPELRPDREWRQLVREEYRGEIEAIIQRTAMDGEAGAATVVCDLPSGTERWLDIVVTARHSHGTRSTGLIITMEDVTGEVEAKAETERLTQMLDASSDYVAVFRPSGELIYVNAATKGLLSALRAEGRSGSLRDLIDDDPRRLWIQEALASLATADVWTGELPLNAGGGRTIPVSALGVVRWRADGEIDWVAMLCRDISELKAAEERLRQLATHDSLTQLPNRALFNDRLDHAIARHRRDQQGVAVMFCDLDGFKAVNDEHGHAAGDVLLVTVADRLRGIIRETDTAARVGGDEFVIVGEGVTSPEELATVAERVIDAVSQPVRLPNGATVRVGISVGVGVARAGDADIDADTLLTTADTAMYSAKARGGNTFRIA